MIILKERQITYKSKPQNSSEVQNFFDLITDTYSDISSALTDLSVAFFNKNWNLKESQSNTLIAYKKAVKSIRIRLDQIGMMNSSLARFLESAKHPIPINKNTPKYIDVQTEIITKQLKLYYKEVKGTDFPKFDNEIKEHKNSIIKINNNIQRMNEINSKYKNGGYSKLCKATSNLKEE